MNPSFFPVERAVRAVWSRWASAPLGVLVLIALAACNGTAVVTLTSTPSTDTFLTYRVGLDSVQLQKANGRKEATMLPAGTTVDLSKLVDLSEVLGAMVVPGGNYSQVVVTVDYSSAEIVYDNGSATGVALTPMGASGQALGRVTLTLDLDPSNQLNITRHNTSLLSLNFNLAATNLVDLPQKTVTVTPMMAASASPIDTKTVRVRGPLAGVNTAKTFFSTGIAPFDFPTVEAGPLNISTSTVTTYEINGVPSTGTTGLNTLASLSPGTMTAAFGSFNVTSTNGTASCADGSTPTTTNGITTCADGSTPTSSDTTVTTCSDGSTPTTINGVSTCANGSTPTTTGETTNSTTNATSVSFAATQVLAGSSVQGGGFDRVSGIVSGRSGDTFTVEDATLLSDSGTNTFVPGTSTITIGADTQVTEFGAASIEADGTQQISVGSLIYAFGTASALNSGNLTLDATAGRARLGTTSASGIVTVQGTGTLSLSLTWLGGRLAGAFDFAGTGQSTGEDASLANYRVNTGSLYLTNATVGLPVEVSNLVAPFAAAPPDFNASTLLDYTTINAELVLDWSGGTPAPFASYDTSQITVDARNSSIGARHVIQDGAQVTDIIGIASDPVIVPSTTGANTVFTIGHSLSGTFESFVTFAAFITQLQTELNGSVLATGMTAIGPYTTTTYTQGASSITIFLND
ncbi:MAG: DUF4382 domain-containing protein [Steroidobacteraceae bacterium]